MYILNASVETSYIGALRFDLLRCNATIAWLRLLTTPLSFPLWKCRTAFEAWLLEFEKYELAIPFGILNMKWMVLSVWINNHNKTIYRIAHSYLLGGTLLVNLVLDLGDQLPWVTFTTELCVDVLVSAVRRYSFLIGNRNMGRWYLGRLCYFRIVFVLFTDSPYRPQLCYS